MSPRRLPCQAVWTLVWVLAWSALGCRPGEKVSEQAGEEVSDAGQTRGQRVPHIRLDDPLLVPTGLDEPVDFVWTGDHRCVVLGRRELLALTPTSGPVQRRLLDGDASALAHAGDWLWVVVEDRVGRVPANDLDAEFVWAMLPPHGRWTGLAAGGQGVLAANWQRLALYDVSLSGKVEPMVLREKGGTHRALVAPSPYLSVRAWPLGGFLVNDPGRHQLLKVDEDRDVTLTFGASGMGPGQWCGCCNPIDFDVSREGLVATAEKGCRRVQLFSGEGEWRGMVALRDDFVDDEKQCDLRGINPVERWLKVRFEGATSIWVLERCTGDLRRFAPPLAEERGNE